MFGEIRINPISRFCRYFAWSRSFVATRLTWFISYRWWWPSGGRQILSLFCVITLCWVIPVQTSIADVVAIMHQNAPFGDFFYTTIADVVGFLRDHALFCNFYQTREALVVAILSFPNKQDKQILSLFCVITLIWVISIQTREGLVVAILSFPNKHDKLLPK